MNVAMNKKDTKLWDCFNNGMSDKCNWFWSVVEETGALILDTRKNRTFAKGFIPQSINIGIEGFCSLGRCFDVKQPIILVTEIGWEEESVTRLAA
jgi:hypothetical protein